jgi:RimJ/RimL family protein N-acetyltransferase
MMTRIENPILLDIPDRFETDRLILQVHLLEFAEAMHAATDESHKELRPWMPWAKNKQSIDEVRAFIRRSQAGYLLRNDFPYSLLAKDDGRYIGNCGVHSRDWAVPSFEVGYWIRTSEAGKGYTTEAVQALTRYFMDEVGAQRMLIRCDVRNKASAAVARKCGYRLEGTMHNFNRDNDGNLVDMLHFVRTPDQQVYGQTN